MRNFISALLPYFRQYRKDYVAGLFGLLVASSTQLFIPNFIQRILDTIHAGLTGGGFYIESIVPLLLTMLAVATITAIARWTWRYWLHGASRSIEADLRQRLFRKYLRLDMAQIQSGTVGDFLARATNDVQAMRMATSIGLVALFDGIFMTVAILLILLLQDPQLTLIIFAPLPVVTAIVLLFGTRIGKLSGTVQEGYSQISTKSQETFANLRVVQTFGIESHLTGKFAESNEEYQRRNVRLALVSGLMHPLIGFVSGISVVLLLFFGGQMMIENSLTPGQFTALLVYLQMLIWPMLGAGFTVSIFQRGAAAWNRVRFILESPDEFEAGSTGTQTAREPAIIEFNDVTAAYGDAVVLSNVNLKFSSGQWIGITGPTGSGKTSFIKLLLRFLEPKKGSISFDGQDIRNIDPYGLRELFAYVPQEGFLFSRSLLKNIEFGVQETPGAEPGWNLDDIIEYSGLRNDLPQFSAGLETEIGEKGVMVSGGQKQRISYARALVSDAPILLIDDGLSALDSRTETRVLDYLAKIRKGKTTVIISQRVRALARCSKIAVFESGVVSAFDTPRKLAKMPGFYADIARLQEHEESEDVE